MKRASPVAAVSFVALAVLVVVASISEVRVAEAVTCSITELFPCAAAFTSTASPSVACCDKLKEKKPCFCGYLSDPNVKHYVDSPKAKTVLAACGIPYPQC